MSGKGYWVSRMLCGRYDVRNRKATKRHSISPNHKIQIRAVPSLASLTHSLPHLFSLPVAPDKDLEVKGKVPQREERDGPSAVLIHCPSFLLVYWLGTMWDRAERVNELLFSLPSLSLSLPFSLPCQGLGMKWTREG